MATNIDGEMSYIAISGITGNTTFVVPAGYAISAIYVENTTANAITGLILGTSSAASDVLAALAVAANALPVITDSLILKKYFSRTTTQTLFLQAAVWNSASINFVARLDRATP